LTVIQSNITVSQWVLWVSSCLSYKQVIRMLCESYTLVF